MKSRHSLYGWGAAIGAGFLLRSAIRRYRWFDLRGKVVLITGGSRGLGLVLARRFAAKGARIIISASDPAELDRAADDLRARGAEAVAALPGDLTVPGRAGDVIRSATGLFGGVDVLVNNAGVIQVGPMEAMTLFDYEQAMAIHFWAPLHMIRAVLPVMRGRGGGRIVNISSIGGKIAVPHLLPYCASKFALTGLSEGLRAELAKDNILVTTVCPPTMRTGSPRNALFKSRHREEYTWFALSDALPLVSLSADLAARRIVLAAQRGEAETMLTIKSRLATMIHGLLPGSTSDIFSLFNRLMPSLGGIGPASASGRQSETPLTHSKLTSLSTRAAGVNNEIPPVSAVRSRPAKLP